jgi:hypothetical protein
MTSKIDHLCDQLRIKLHGLDRRLESLKGNTMATSEKSQDLVEVQLNRIEQHIFERRNVVKIATAHVSGWLGGRKANFDAKRGKWKEHCKVLPLNERADDAEAYAVAVFELAAAAVDEAAQAALEALLARNDANVAGFGGLSSAPRVIPSRPDRAL